MGQNMTVRARLRALAWVGLWMAGLVAAAGAAGAAEPAKTAAKAVPKATANKARGAGPAAAGWTRLTNAEFAACGREIRLLRGYVHMLRDVDLREQCQGGDREVETCDAPGRNCKKIKPCSDMRRQVDSDKAGTDVDWFLRGNSSCEASSYPCWGDSVVNANPETDEDRQAWLDGQTDNAAIPYELTKLKPAPVRLEAGQEPPEAAMRQVEDAVRACLAKTWLAKHRAQSKTAGAGLQPAAAGPAADAAANAANAANASNAANAANAATAVSVINANKGAMAVGAVAAVPNPAPPASLPAQPAAVEVPPPTLTGPQCQAEILKVHREARAAVQAVPNPVAVRAVNAETARRQKELFTTSCAAQPDAAEYVAAADRQLAAAAAAPAAPSAAAVPPGGFLGGAGAVAEAPGGAMVVTSAAPANECLRALETGLYGGFVNKCAYKVNVAYCVSNPKKGGWTDTDAFRCLSPTNAKPSNLYVSVPASKSEAQHTKGGDAVLWLACKDPAVPYQVRFDGGRMLGTCKDR